MEQKKTEKNKKELTEKALTKKISSLLRCVANGVIIEHTNAKDMRYVRSKTSAKQ